eukprot:SAG11_NODE_4089_length_2070_cov_2.606799_2_plen_149_part_00
MEVEEDGARGDEDSAFSRLKVHLFPTFATRDDGDVEDEGGASSNSGSWTAHIHGWIFDPAPEVATEPVCSTTSPLPPFPRRAGEAAVCAPRREPARRSTVGPAMGGTLKLMTVSPLRRFADPFLPLDGKLAQLWSANVLPAMKKQRVL